MHEDTLKVLQQFSWKDATIATAFSVDNFTVCSTLEQNQANKRFSSNEIICNVTLSNHLKLFKVALIDFQWHQAKRG